MKIFVVHFESFPKKGEINVHLFDVCCFLFSLPVARSAHGATVYSDKLWIFAGYDGNARYVENFLSTFTVHVCMFCTKLMYFPLLQAE